MRRENAFCNFHTFFGFVYHVSCLPWFKTKNKWDVLMPRSMHLHTEIFPNLKSISELFKIYMKSLDTFILASRDNWVSCNQTLGCLHLYGDIRVSRAQPRINAYMRYCCSIIDCCFFASCFEINVFYFTNLDKLFFK